MIGFESQTAGVPEGTLGFVLLKLLFGFVLPKCSRGNALAAFKRLCSFANAGSATGIRLSPGGSRKLLAHALNLCRR
jgi:hypothetical protein